MSPAGTEAAGGVGTGPECAAGQGCITCGDVAIVLTVFSANGPDALCRDSDGRQEQVAVELVGPVTAGDRLLVHAGVALERLSREGGW